MDTSKIKVYSVGKTAYAALRNLFGENDGFVEFGGDRYAAPHPDGYTFSKFVLLKYDAIGNRKAWTEKLYAEGYYIPGGAVVTNLTELSEEFVYSVTDCPLLSCGATPQAAVQNLATELEWTNVRDLAILGRGAFDWGHSFFADDTSMKSAGINVPGGSIVTWWK